jgi:uncharacterized protein (DUF1330 family)
MAKGYWIVHIEVHDPETYKKYAELAGPAVFAFDGKYLARGGAHETMEGEELGPRHVVVEFPSYQVALDCYRSDQYQTALKIRKSASKGRLVISEGVA